MFKWNEAVDRKSGAQDNDIMIDWLIDWFDTTFNTLYRHTSRWVDWRMEEGIVYCEFNIQHWKPQQLTDFKSGWDLTQGPAGWQASVLLAQLPSPYS